jgi:hypothetical protein
MTEIFIFVLGVIAFFGILIFLLKKVKQKVSTIEIIIAISYFVSLIVFDIGLSSHNNQYYTPIDPVDYCYTPFASKHLLTLLIFIILFNISAFIIWARGISLPPLLLVLLLVMIVIGLILNIAVVLQVSEHNTESLSTYRGQEEKYLFLFAPILGFIIGISLIVKVVNQKIDDSLQKIYSNKFLNNINSFLYIRKRQPFFVFLLLLPIFLIITIILTLIGQEPNAIIKVFTDTTTWKFSQQMHPPILDHTGHYLCTVAACGNPKIVKPLRLGIRGGNQIIVNRQLLIANAFENLLEVSFPQLHIFIRSNYDKYGYNLSKKINSSTLSNITYLIMKPLEWFFLIILYLFCSKPEEMIMKQYSE